MAWRMKGGDSGLAGHRFSLTHWALVMGPCWHGCLLTQLVSIALGFCTRLEAEGGGEGRHGPRRAVMTGGSLLNDSSAEGGAWVGSDTMWRPPFIWWKCPGSSRSWGLWRGTPYSSPTHGTHRGLPVGRPLPLGWRLWWALPWVLWSPAAWPMDTASGLSLPSHPTLAHLGGRAWA